MLTGEPRFTKPNYIPFPDDYTKVLKECSANEIVVVSYIITKTLKYRKLSDVIAISQINEGVSISRASICRAIESLREGNYLNIVYLCADCEKPTVKVMSCKTPYKDKTRTTYLYKCSECGCRENPLVQYSLTYGEEMKALLCEVLNMSNNGKGLEGGSLTERQGQSHTEMGGSLTVRHTRDHKQDTIIKKPEEEAAPINAITENDVHDMQMTIVAELKSPSYPSPAGTRRLLEKFEHTEFWGKRGSDYVKMILADLPPNLKSGDPLRSLWSACRDFPEWNKDKPVPERMEIVSENPEEDEDFMESKRQYGLYLAWKSNGSNTPGLAAAALRICIGHCEAYGERLEGHLGITAIQLQTELGRIT